MLIGAVSLLALVGVGGCSKSPYDLAQAGGAVTIDGVPFTTGKVMFAPIAKGEDRRAGRPALGRLQSDGSFTLSTYEEGDGAIVGEHWVHRDSNRRRGRRAVFHRSSFHALLVPAPLNVVADQENRFDIKLTRDQILKFAEKDD